MNTITSANSVFTLTVPDVFPIPMDVQGYAADDAFANDAIDIAEAVMGVDGNMSAGYTPNPTKIQVMLQADSPSIAIFEQWHATMKAAREVFFGSVIIALPSTGKVYECSKGVLNRGKQIPDAKKILQPQQWELTFESVISSDQIF